jgi:hypothetical protein
VPAAAVDRAERGDVGRYDDVPRHADEETPLVVDDRPARADEVDRSIRLPVGDRRVCASVQDLDRPRAQREDADADADECGESADAQEEAGATEEGRVCARVRL